MYHYTDGGLRNVWLANGYIEHTTKYGKGISINDVDGLNKAICEALTNKPGKLTGAEFRYLRMALELSQKTLGKLLGYTEQAIAKWEKTGKIPKTSDYVIRIIYLQKHAGNEKVCSMIQIENMIERLSSDFRIVVTEKREKWNPAFESDKLDQLKKVA